MNINMLSSIWAPRAWNTERGLAGMARAAPIELGQPRTLRVAMNLRRDIRPNLREGDRTCPAARLGSGRVLFSKETVRRLGIERCESRIEAETGPAVETEDRVRSAGTRRCTRIPAPRCRFQRRRGRSRTSDGRCRTSTQPVAIGERSGQSAASARGRITLGEHDVVVFSCREDRPSERGRRSTRRRETTVRPDRPDRPRTGRDVGRSRRTRAPVGRHAPC